MWLCRSSDATLFQAANSHSGTLHSGRGQTVDRNPWDTKLLFSPGFLEIHLLATFDMIFFKKKKNLLDKFQPTIHSTDVKISNYNAVRADTTRI